MGLISESKIRSNKYIPVSLQITIPFNNFETSSLYSTLIQNYP